MKVYRQYEKCSIVDTGEEYIVKDSDNIELIRFVDVIMAVYWAEKYNKNVLKFGYYNLQYV
jgi:hypothetical protein